MATYLIVRTRSGFERRHSLAPEDAVIVPEVAASQFYKALDLWGLLKLKFEETIYFVREIESISFHKDDGAET